MNNSARYIHEPNRQLIFFTTSVYVIIDDRCTYCVINKCIENVPQIPAPQSYRFYDQNINKYDLNSGRMGFFICASDDGATRKTFTDDINQ